MASTSLLQKIIRSLFLGIISAFGALILEVSLSILTNRQGFDPSYFHSITWTMFLFVAIEESIKFAVIYRNQVNIESHYNTSRIEDTEGKLILNKSVASLRRKRFEGFCQSLLIGSGFALAESFIIFLNDAYQTETKILGILGLLMIQVLTAGMMGYLLARSQPLARVFILILAISLHFLYNAMVIFGMPYLVIFSYFAVIAFVLSMSCKITDRC